MPQLNKMIKAFYVALFSGKISEAEKLLERIKKNLSDENDAGYHDALYGIYYAYVNDDTESFVYKIWTDENLKKHRKKLAEEFEKKAKLLFTTNPGFYRAWSDFLNMLHELPVPHKMLQKQSSQEDVMEEYPAH
ncbi:MAG: hypothetical protein RMJ14_00085 [Nitrososphaerota archaeon]|nr:hypothetical protein [Aigarchaeota archaeon]MDW8076031.1 hypothetical protein [Nitrososphaerota archaeon]